MPYPPGPIHHAGAMWHIEARMPYAPLIGNFGKRNM